jgi:hypothetical protein
VHGTDTFVGNADIIETLPANEDRLSSRQHAFRDLTVRMSKFDGWHILVRSNRAVNSNHRRNAPA